MAASYSNVVCLDYLSQSITGRACLHLEQSCCLKTSKAIMSGSKQSKTLMACLKSTKEKNGQTCLTVITRRMKGNIADLCCGGICCVGLRNANCSQDERFVFLSPAKGLGFYVS